MSNLPYEIVDHIVDLLHDSQIPLRNCCFVSKSWIPRTRMHLFAEIRFQTAMNLQSWKQTFRDPSTSPACYTKSLLIGSEVLTDADADGNGWIEGFSSVVHLELVGQDTCGWRVARVLFRGFSVIQSFRVDFCASADFSSSQIFDLILSFPLLDHLSVTDYRMLDEYHMGDNYTDSDEVSAVIQPSSLLMFTGSLKLRLQEGIGPVVRRLLSLPGGVHFRKLNLAWSNTEDILLMIALVKRCSHTLESLEITCVTIRRTSIGYLCSHGSNSFLFPGGPETASFNLLKATKLQDAVFLSESASVK